MKIKLKNVKPNDVSQAGNIASRKTLFGDENDPGRFAVAAIHSRFGQHRFAVWDAAFASDEYLDGRPGIIRDEATLEAAVAGLPGAE